MKKNKHKVLALRLVLLSIVWIISGLLLHRTGYSYTGGEAFDWQGAVFMIITLGIAVYGFSCLKKAQRDLKHPFTIYGLIWLIPTIILSAAFAGVTAVDKLNTSAPSYCSTTLFPSICRLTDGPTGKIIETTYQSGYIINIILGLAVLYSIYRFLKTRIKGYRREDLFQ